MWWDGEMRWKLLRYLDPPAHEDAGPVVGRYQVVDVDEGPKQHHRHRRRDRLVKKGEKATRNQMREQAIAQCCKTPRMRPKQARPTRSVLSSVRWRLACWIQSGPGRGSNGTAAGM